MCFQHRPQVQEDLALCSPRACLRGIAYSASVSGVLAVGGGGGCAVGGSAPVPNQAVEAQVDHMLPVLLNVIVLAETALVVVVVVVLMLVMLMNDVLLLLVLVVLVVAFLLVIGGGVQLVEAVLQVGRRGRVTEDGRRLSAARGGQVVAGTPAVGALVQVAQGHAHHARDSQRHQADDGMGTVKHCATVVTIENED